MKEKVNNISLQEPKLPKALENARRNNGGMTVPAGFFDAFEQKMNAVIDAEVLVQNAKQTPSIVPQPKQENKVNRRWINVAAAALLVVVLGAAFQFDWLGLNKPADTTELTPVSKFAETETVDFEQIPDAVQKQVIEDMLADVDDYDVFDMYFEI